jgi:putative zinc finger/helix-turn-helix YgiT family protein
MEEDAMKCMRCGGSMTSRRETRHAYAGLEGVILEGVPVRHCSDCGEEEISYPYVEHLHMQLALQLARKEAALTPREVRFLRTYLGLSGSDLARRMGATKEMVSRWERLAQAAKTEATPLRVRLKPGKQGWTVELSE